jgi:trigger factor
VLGLLVAFLIKQHSVVPDRERIQSQIETLSSVYENPADVVKWYASNKRAKADVEMQVLEEQLVEKLLENVQVTEKMVSYSDLIKVK